MLAKRIIPCLDVTDGRVVKGVNFINLTDVGDPVEIAKFYNDQNADELVFLDITATSGNRKTMVDVIKRCAKEVFIPLTVGGGIKTVDDFTEILRAGADKVSINSAAIENPQLIKDASDRFGAQCVVLAVDAKERNDKSGWNVYTHGGRKDTGLDVEEWIKKAVDLGAGEILLTSMDADGTKQGYDLKLTKTISDMVDVPVIASGGCGSLEDFKDVFEQGNADAALAASLFHYRELTVSEVKKYLSDNDIEVRK
jgi:cyclase